MFLQGVGVLLVCLGLDLLFILSVCCLILAHNNFHIFSYIFPSPPITGEHDIGFLYNFFCIITA